jgi:hypothetical protein
MQFCQVSVLQERHTFVRPPTVPTSFKSKGPAWRLPFCENSLQIGGTPISRSRKNPFGHSEGERGELDWFGFALDFPLPFRFPSPPTSAPTLVRLKSHHRVTTVRASSLSVITRSVIPQESRIRTSPFRSVAFFFHSSRRFVNVTLSERL